jgi:diaminohydroxyphosphoribosylaminopyrimidine deaminase / 5-amino-6-(5-phosphoribosylamino)uracil reductase
MPPQDVDRRAMLQALDLARRGEGLVEPNPMVGCVIVHNGQTVGAGWHHRFGGDHAEIEALRAAGQTASGATLYVTLEPCCHTGKTPPCTEALITAGICRVVCAAEDPNPRVAGKGTLALRAAGIQVETGLLQGEAEQLIAPFTKLMVKKRPWVIAKWAMTLDGKLATRTGSSQWISAATSRKMAHQLRGRVDAILVGRGTMLADDPQLTAQPPGPRTATRIVLDSCCQMPAQSRLARTARKSPVLLVVGEQANQERCHRLQEMGVQVLKLSGENHSTRLQNLLDQLGCQGITNLLVEGGGQVLGAFFDLGEVDEVHTFVAPKLVGGQTAITPVAGQGLQTMAEALSLDHVQIERLEGDVHLWGRVVRERKAES